MVKRLAGPLIPPFVQTAGSGAAPLYRQVYLRIRNAVLGGSLAPGDRLPSTRTLARDIGVSRNTVEVAFGQLESEGFLERRVGAGSFVAGCVNGFAKGQTVAPTPARLRAEQAGDAGSLSARGRRMTGAACDVDRGAAPTLGPCMTSLDGFPLRTWNRVAARRARLSGVALLGEKDPAGYRPLREAVAGHLCNARGVMCDWRQVIILTSTQQALDLASRLLLDPGDGAWLEEPGYLGARAALESAEARIVPVPVDESGMDVGAGVALAPDARLAYVTPSHQYPLGHTMGLARRLALLDWANRAGAWVFEDDYDSEFRYSGRPLAAVQGLDEGGRVIYAGTFNKVMFPSLRLAYVVVPDRLVDAFVCARALNDGHAPALSQAVMADFIADGHFSAHLRQTRALYQERRDTLLDAAARSLGTRVRLGVSDTGLHVTALLPHGADDRRISERASERKLDVPPLSRYYLQERHRRPGLVLNYAGAPTGVIRRSIQTLAAAL